MQIWLRHNGTWCNFVSGTVSAIWLLLFFEQTCNLSFNLPLKVPNLIPSKLFRIGLRTQFWIYVCTLHRARSKTFLTLWDKEEKKPESGYLERWPIRNKNKNCDHASRRQTIGKSFKCLPVDLVNTLDGEMWKINCYAMLFAVKFHCLFWAAARGDLAAILATKFPYRSMVLLSHKRYNLLGISLFVSPFCI